MADALDARRCPGHGGLPVGPFLDALPLNTPLSLEIRSLELREVLPDPADRAVAIWHQTQQWLRDARPSPGA